MSLQPEAVAYHTDKNGSSYFFGAGSAPAPAPAPASPTAKVWTSAPSGVIDLSTYPVGGYTVLSAGYATGPGGDYIVNYTGTPANGAFWVIQSNCVYNVTIKHLVGSTQTPLGTIQAKTPGEPQTGIITYQSGQWYFY